MHQRTPHCSPTVSVVIPTYNCDRYLPAAIESVLSQTYLDYELIVVDDGSTDQTQQVLKPYLDQLRLVQQANQGVAIARNQGIAVAQGEWIAFLDADDWFLPDKLAAQITLAETDPSLGMIHSGWQRVSATGAVLKRVEPWHQVPTLNLESWLRWKPVLPSAMLFRRDWLERVGGFDPRFPPAEDTDLVLRLALKGCRAVWLEQITVSYRQHENSAMHQGLPQARSLVSVIDHFFAQPDVPASIRYLESQVRYSSLVWIAWYLYHTQHPTEMVHYLKQAWHHSPYSLTETLVHWADSFTEFAQNWGTTLNPEILATQPEWQRLLRWMLQESMQR